MNATPHTTVGDRAASAEARWVSSDLQHSEPRAQRALAITQLALASAQPLAAYVTRLTGRGVSEAERARVVDGPVSPTPGAFAIWLPLFATSITHGVRMVQAPERLAVSWVLPDGMSPLRPVAWLTNAAYACNAAWSLQAQLRGLGWPSVGIICAGAASAAAALIAAERLPDAVSGARPSGEATARDALSRDELSHKARAAANAIAPLAGWLTLATFANVEATLNETGGRPRERRETKRALALLGAACAAAGSITLASRGNRFYTAAVAWGLGGVLVRNLRARNTAVATAAGIGFCAALGATLFGVSSSRWQPASDASSTHPPS